MWRGLGGLLAWREMPPPMAETPFHALSAGGTFAYHYGVFALRDEYVVGKEWAIDRIDGMKQLDA